MKFIIDKASNGEFFYKIVGGNGETMMVSETVKNEADAQESIESIQRGAYGARIERPYTTKKRPGDTVKLTQQQFDLLEHVARNPNNRLRSMQFSTATKNALLDKNLVVWRGFSGAHITEEGKAHLERRK